MQTKICANTDRASCKYMQKYSTSCKCIEQKETVAELPGLASPGTMECDKGLLPAFGVGFTPHIQRQARRPACGAADDVRAGDQPEGRQGPRPHYAPNRPLPGG